MENPKPSGTYRVVQRAPVENGAQTENVSDHPTGEGKDVLPRHWFVASLGHSGEIVKKEANSITGIKEICDAGKIAWVDYWADNFEKQAVQTATQLGFSSALVTSLIGQHFAPYQDLDTEMGIQLPSIYVRGFDVKKNPLLILIKRNVILTLHPFSPDRRFALLRRYSDSILRRIPADVPQEDKVTILLSRLIDENNDRNFGELRKIEEAGDKLSESLSDPRTSRQQIGGEIHLMKHALITYLNDMWDTVHVLHTLRYGDAEVITNDPALLARIGALADEVSRQIGLSEHLSEVLASGLEVLQSIYNNQLQLLNNRLALMMTYLTIIGTAVLVPNTLGTILGNTVFDLTSHDLWWYIPVMVVSTIISGWVAYWWVKRQGWIKKMGTDHH